MKTKLRSMWLVCWAGLLIGIFQLGISIVSHRQTTELFDSLDETIDLLTSNKIEFAVVKLLPQHEGEIFTRRLQSNMKVVSSLRDLLRGAQQMRYRDARADMKFGAVVAFLFGAVMWGLRKLNLPSAANNPSAKPD